jgi:hypothetical protein
MDNTKLRIMATIQAVIMFFSLFLALALFGGRLDGILRHTALVVLAVFGMYATAAVAWYASKDFT